jgi:hypothetical protein
MGLMERLLKGRQLEAVSLAVCGLGHAGGWPLVDMRLPEAGFFG